MAHDTKVSVRDVKKGDKPDSYPGKQMPADNPDSSAPIFPGKRRSDNQQQASRANDRRSPGPTSADGKQKAAQNSVRDGIFSRQVVIEELGETREDFERVKRTHFDSLRPCDGLQEQYVMDMAENAFLRERVRRAEELERRNRLDTFQLENELKRADQLDQFRDRFLIEFEHYVGDSEFTFRRLPHALDEARRDLMSMSEGIGFLLFLLAEVEVCFREAGTLMEKHRSLFDAIRGSAHPLDIRNWIEHLTTHDFASAPTGEPESEPSYAEQEEISADDEAKSCQRPCDAKTDPVTAGLAAFISSVAESLRDRKEKLERIEEGEVQKEIALIMLDPSPTERFSRAETSRERKMYRALVGLSQLRAMATSSPLSLAAGSVSLAAGEFTSSVRGKIAKRTREAPRGKTITVPVADAPLAGNLRASLPEATRNVPPPS